MRLLNLSHVEPRLDTIARQGLQRAQQPHWFRATTRQVLDAEDALADVDSVVRQAGSKDEQEALRIVHAAVRATEDRSTDRLAALQEGLALFAAGSVGFGAPNQVAAAIVRRMREQGGDVSAVQRALQTEKRAISHEHKRASTLPPSLRVANAPHLMESLPDGVVRASNREETLLHPHEAEAMLRMPANEPTVTVTIPERSTGWLAKTMRFLGLRVAGPVAGPIGGAAAHFAALPMMKIPSTPAEYAVAEAYLRDTDARIAQTQSIGTGINASTHVGLSNRAQAMWKPSAGEDKSVLRDQIEAGNQGKREAAAYVVDRWMGHYGKVQPTVYRKMGRQNGAMMWWLNGVEQAEDSKRASQISSSARNSSYRRMAVLDNVLGNTDRHNGNWMVAGKQDVEAIPIDHGLCFPLQNKEQGGINYDFDKQVKLDDKATAALKSLKKHRKEITAELEALLHPKAINALFERVDTMLKLGHTYDAWRV